MRLKKKKEKFNTKYIYKKKEGGEKNIKQQQTRYTI